jgi:hypothetical protein
MGWIVADCTGTVTNLFRTWLARGSYMLGRNSLYCFVLCSPFCRCILVHCCALYASFCRCILVHCLVPYSSVSNLNAFGTSPRRRGRFEGLSHLQEVWLRGETIVRREAFRCREHPAPHAKQHRYAEAWLPRRSVMNLPLSVPDTVSRIPLERHTLQ